LLLNIFGVLLFAAQPPENIPGWVMVGTPVVAGSLLLFNAYWGERRARLDAQRESSINIKKMRHAIGVATNWLHDRDRGTHDMYNRSRLPWYEYAKKRYNALGLEDEAIPERGGPAEPRTPEEKVPGWPD
jgi:hypothetical protein